MLVWTRVALFIIVLSSHQTALCNGDDPDTSPCLNISNNGNDDQRNQSGQGLVPIRQSASQGSEMSESRENSTCVDIQDLEEQELGTPRRACQDPGNTTASTPAAEECLDQQTTSPNSGKENEVGQGSRLIDQGSVGGKTYESVVEVTQVLIVIIGGAGMMENAVNAVVFARPSMRNPSSVILLYFSIAEFLYCLLSVVWQAFGYHFGNDAVNKYVYLMLAIYLTNYSRVAIRRWALCLNLLVSCERFVAIAFPLRFKSLRLTRHPAAMCLALAVLMLLVHVYNIFKNDVVEQHPGTYRMAKSARAEEHGQLFETLSTVSKALFVFVPLLASLLFNVLTMTALHRHARRRQRLHETKDNNQASQHERQTTVVVLVSSVLFVLLSLPTALVSLVQNFHPSFGTYVLEHYLYLTSLKVASLCEVVSNATSFLVYLALSSRFRKELAAIFPRGRVGRGRSSKVSFDNPVSCSGGDVTSISMCAETSLAGLD